MIQNPKIQAPASRLRRDLGTLESYGALIGILIGAGLLLSYMTRQMAEAASGVEGKANPIARSLVELSHGPVIISLALYLPLSLLR